MMRDRNALELCLLSWVAVSTTPSAVFVAELPPSLKAVPILGHAVAMLVAIGCIGAVIGISLNDLDKALVTEQFFLALLGLGFLGYAAALLRAAYLRFPVDHSAYSGSAYIIGVCLGVASFTIWRFVQVQRYVKRRKQLGERSLRRTRS